MTDIIFMYLLFIIFVYYLLLVYYYLVIFIYYYLNLFLGNECAWLLLSLLQAKTCSAHELLYEIIDFELEHAEELSDVALASTLQLIAKVNLRPI